MFCEKSSIPKAARLVAARSMDWGLGKTATCDQSILVRGDSPQGWGEGRWALEKCAQALICVRTTGEGGGWLVKMRSQLGGYAVGPEGLHSTSSWRWGCCWPRDHTSNREALQGLQSGHGLQCAQYIPLIPECSFFIDKKNSKMQFRCNLCETVGFS